MKIRTLAITLAILPALWLTAAHAAKSDAMTAAEHSVMEAKSALQAAAKAKNEWRDTAKIIKAAEKAMKSGDYATAMSLATKARLQSEMAISQAQANANAGNPGYLYR